jgi:hypothetical protein
MARPINELAEIIYNEAREERRQGKGKWFVYAKPYVEAMGSLSTITDNYYMDSGHSVVSYALANLSGWKGEVARQVKAELKQHLTPTR